MVTTTSRQGRLGFLSPEDRELILHAQEKIDRVRVRLMYTYSCRECSHTFQYQTVAEFIRILDDHYEEEHGLLFQERAVRMRSERLNVLELTLADIKFLKGMRISPF